VGRVLSENVGALLNAPITVAGSVGMASYSRGQESEADELGIRLAAASGYDPGSLAVILAHLEEAQEAQTGKAAAFSFFASHPMTPTRVKEIDRAAAAFKWSPQPPIAADRREFLRRLDGLVLEEDPALGLFKGRQFFHPDVNFTITFPKQWKTLNTPSGVAAFAEKKEALAVIGLAGKDADPDKVADTLIKDMKRQHKVEPAETRAVAFGDWHGRLVTYTDTTGREPMALHFLWVRMGSMTYQLVGVGPERYRELLRETAMSLRPMTADERRSVTVKRLRLVEARAGETLAELGERASNTWTPAYTAIANGLPETTALEAGQLIKISREEPYRSE
jgi:predicted Zn-dependent protease